MMMTEFNLRKVGTKWFLQYGISRDDRLIIHGQTDDRHDRRCMVGTYLIWMESIESVCRTYIYATVRCLEDGI